MSALQALVATATPERRPRSGDLGWLEVYELLGTPLPADYVALTARHGGGLVGCGGWLGLCDPLERVRPGALVACATDAGDAYRYLRDGPPGGPPGQGFPEDFPRAAWPEPGGFLACGASREGDYVGWLTEGRPDRWPVMVWPANADGDTVIDLPITEVLLRWLNGVLDVPGLPRCERRHDHDGHRLVVW